MPPKLKVKEVIRKILQEDERARNDDKWLFYRVMREYTNIFIPFEDFERIPSPATILRDRRKVQNEDKELVATDPEVYKKREPIIIPDEDRVREIGW